MRKVYSIILLILLTSARAGAQDDLQRGMQAFQEERYQEAVEYFVRALQDDNQTTVYIYLGHAYFRLQQWGNAINAYKRALDGLKPMPAPQEDKTVMVETYRLLGQAQYMSQKYDQAIQSFRKADQLDPAGKDLLNLAQCYMATERWTPALHEVVEYLDDHTEDVAAWELAAYLFLQTDHLSEAIGVHQRLIRKRPEETRSYLALAQAYLAADNYDRAIDTLEYAGRICPDQHEKILRPLADLYNQQAMPREAAYCYQRLIASLEKPGADDYFRLGYAYFQTQEYASAQEAFAQVLQLDAGHYRACLYLGQIAAQNHDVEAARRNYLAAARIDPNSPEPYVLLADCQMKHDFYAPAAENFAQALQKGENSVAVLYNYILTLMKMEKFTMVKTVLKQALEIHPAQTQFNSLLEHLARREIAL